MIEEYDIIRSMKFRFFEIPISTCFCETLFHVKNIGNNNIKISFPLSGDKYKKKFWQRYKL